MVDAKRDEINLAHGLQNFHIECNETIVSYQSETKQIVLSITMDNSHRHMRLSVETIKLFSFLSYCNSDRLFIDEITGCP